MYEVSRNDQEIAFINQKRKFLLVYRYLIELECATDCACTGTGTSKVPS
jgi:hypothetical protein